jgi:hypothetical protein
VSKPVSSPNAGLLAAYRRGLGLAAVTLVADSSGTRITTMGPEGDEAALARWWCRRHADAERVAAAATRRLRRRQAESMRAVSNGPASPCSENAADDSFRLAEKAIAAAARDLNVGLYNDEEIVQAAMAAAARIDSEVERMQRSGELKSVNKSYQSYRIETSARGDKVMPYQDWMRQYKENLLCKLAATLGQL